VVSERHVRIPETQNHCKETHNVPYTERVLKNWRAVPHPEVQSTPILMVWNQAFATRTCAITAIALAQKAATDQKFTGWLKTIAVT
jgi:hypothetical protein